ncbi:MAG TPA: hypothetical protein PLW44_05345, partial [Chitinophagales bacterium]|nr:hypothetical protein [Chitinophagales bacterium]
ADYKWYREEGCEPTPETCSGIEFHNTLIKQRPKNARLVFSCAANISAKIYPGLLQSTLQASI